MTNHKVLCLQGQDSHRSQLPFNNNWALLTATDKSTACRLVDEHAIKVGLTIFSQHGLDYEYQLFEELLLDKPHISWVAITHDDLLTSDQHRQLISQHCQDYHTLPINGEHLAMTLGRAYGMATLSIDPNIEIELCPHEIVGISPAMKELFSNIKKASQVDAPVLIGGESGTGKELIAAAIHQHSARSKRPFVAVNCGALASNLVQSELFGHERGAFTGAASRKIGRIEAANEGTIFLDEIGDLPLDLQANLLRFLQEQTIERVGSHQSIKTNVRVIAATHVDLEQAIKKGNFREDLYYRLNVLNLHAPPLCQRSGDIELMARIFFCKFAKEKNGKVKGFSQQAISALRQYHWPGNVRELINRIRRAMVMCDNRLIRPRDLGLTDQPKSSQEHPLNLEQARAAAEANAIRNVLLHTEQNISCAARILGISRVTLYRLIKKYNIALDQQ